MSTVDVLWVVALAFRWWRRLITVRVLMWPPNAKLPRSAPAVLNGRCRARLNMSRSSHGVVLRGLPARGRSVTFPVWRKRCISRTMMKWLTLKWSATLLWLKQLSTFLVWLIFAAPYQPNRKWNWKLYTKKSAFVRKHKCWKVHVALYTPCHIHINKNRSITCFTGM
jgi:hypothetical protein